jgi:hypothetical protein
VKRPKHGFRISVQTQFRITNIKLLIPKLKEVHLATPRTSTTRAFINSKTKSQIPDQSNAVQQAGERGGGGVDRKIVVKNRGYKNRGCTGTQLQAVSENSML